MTLSGLLPYPPSLPLPEGLDRHDPTPRQSAEAMHLLAGSLPWPRLGWPELLEALVSLGRTDIPLGRLVEGHVDALRILRQGGRAPEGDSLYGVWASRSHATGVRARVAPGGWRLDGQLRFASGAGVIDRALVPVWVTPEEHLLLDLPAADWPVDASAWRTTAMAASRSHTIHLEDRWAPSSALVGPPCFYLERPGFFPGGVGVAAVWAGGAARLADLLLDHLAAGKPSPSRARRWGEVRTELAVVHALLASAALRLEGAGEDDRPLLRVVATETRAGVAAAVRRVVGQARVLAGAAGLAYAADLTHAIDDLDLYIAQQNPDTDAEFLGALPR